MLLGEVDVCDGGGSAGVGDGELGPLAEHLDEFLVDAFAESFYVCGVDQELVTVGCDVVEILWGDVQVC